VLPAKLGGRQASLLLFDHPDDLRLGETALPHVVCSFRLGRLYIMARELPGGRSSGDETLFYCIPAALWESILDRLEDVELNALADARAGQALHKVVIASDEDREWVASKAVGRELI
jgi:hypothetical protein